jgi:predicted nucleic acid-binding Zn ribbon protein
MNNLANSSTSTPIPESWVEKLFHKMLLEYGKKFTDQWGAVDTDELIAHWSHELSGYAGHEFKRGLSAISGKEWPPTLPEFKKMCRPPVNEMTGYYEAIAGLEARAKGEMGAWSHPAIYWAANLLRTDLLSQTYAQVKERWGALLKAQMERGEWADIPQARVLLPAPDISPQAKANAAAMLANLGASGIIGRKGENHKAWAARLLDRHERKDPSLSALQVKFARMAVGITGDMAA